jgi:hypothetical protein
MNICWYISMFCCLYHIKVKKSCTVFKLYPLHDGFHKPKLYLGAHWIVKLGHLNIYTPVALLSSYLTQPRQGHLQAICVIYQ